MRRRESIIITFALLVLLFFIIRVGSNWGIVLGVRGIFEKILSPFESLTLNISRAPSAIFHDGELAKLKDENKKLLTDRAEFEKLKQDNQALRDQFQNSTTPTTNLLPAHIIGMPSFVPGVVTPDTLILDKGKSDGIAIGEAVILNDDLAGKISKVSIHTAEVTLVTSPNFSSTATTSQTNALGILKGEGNGDMILDNVLLSDQLKIGDAVITKGEETLDALGIAPNLIIGKIVSVDKKASSLFQTAKIKSLSQVSSASLLFIVLPSK